MSGEGIPMSDELKRATIERESKEAMTDLVEEIEEDLKRLRRVIADFKEDSDTATVGFIAAVISLQAMHEKCHGVIRRFQRRTQGLL